MEIRQLSMSLQDEDRSDRPLFNLDAHSIEEPNSEDKFKQLYKKVRRNENIKSQILFLCET